MAKHGSIEHLPFFSDKLSIFHQSGDKAALDCDGHLYNGREVMLSSLSTIPGTKLRQGVKDISCYFNTTDRLTDT